MVSRTTWSVFQRVAPLARAVLTGRRCLQLPVVPVSGVTALDTLPSDNAVQEESQVYRFQPFGANPAPFRLNLDTMNPSVRAMEYAVRGKLPQEAMRIDEEIRSGADHKYPFSKVLFCNIGDCHAMGQRPLTFVRQLLAVCLDSSLLTVESYPTDVRERARDILADAKGRSLGSYTDSRGLPLIRKHVAEFISQRDGFPCSWENVYLLNGASEGIKALLLLCMGQGRDAGVMIPRPQYPLYTASIAELNAQPIHYHLSEEENWAINVEELQRAIREAPLYCQPRVMVVINPGNPTGQFLPVENMRDIIRFCHKEGLVLFTDEVYQENIYPKEESGEEVPFLSFRKVLKTMGPEFEDFQLISFNSTSKGFLGECGIRGGYMEMEGLDDDVMEQLYKVFSTKLCPNTAGQVVTEALVNWPQPGEPSFQLFEEERCTVLETLRRKAEMAHQRLNHIPGVSCNRIQGAMYTFPRVYIPEEAWEDSRLEDPTIPLDQYYCLQFLRKKGVCVVPGSGFGQKRGTWHFRTTILPPEEDLEAMLNRFHDFHCSFLRKYGKMVN